MGPGLEKNLTSEKQKEFLACVENVYNFIGEAFRGIKILKDGRIICYDYHQSQIKIYKYIDKNFILDFEFQLENEVGESLYEVEENILLIGGFKKLILYDIRNNEAKLLQKIEFDYTTYFVQIIELSDGLIAIHNETEILFYIYDKQNKKIEKNGEIKPNDRVLKIFKAKNGNIISGFNKGFVVYDKNNSIQTKIEFDNYTLKYDLVDNKYLIYSYYQETKFYVKVYDIENFISLQTLEVKYILTEIVKLNDNLLIASDNNGNIFELTIGNNFQLSTKDIFRAHEGSITGLCKFDDNKVLSISNDGSIKLWEFN